MEVPMPKRKTRSSKSDEDEADRRTVQKKTAAPEAGTPRKDGNARDREHSEPQDGTVKFKVDFNDKEIICERRGQGPALIFTHGAGGGIAAPATADFATGYAHISPVVCYEGSMNLKNRVKSFNAVIDHCGFGKAIGGRSMGARAAVLTALERQDDGEAERVEALVLVSYPLMAGSNGDKREYEWREKILTDLQGEVDVLFVIGSKDAMCEQRQLAALRKDMKARSWLCVVDGADHGMSVGKKTGVQQMRWKTGEVAAEWVKGRDEMKRFCSLSWNEDEAKVDGGSWQAHN